MPAEPDFIANLTARIFSVSTHPVSTSACISIRATTPPGVRLPDHMRSLQSIHVHLCGVLSAKARADTVPLCRSGHAQWFSRQFRWLYLPLSVRYGNAVDGGVRPADRSPYTRLKSSRMLATRLESIVALASCSIVGLFGGRKFRYPASFTARSHRAHHGCSSPAFPSWSAHGRSLGTAASKLARSSRTAIAATSGRDAAPLYIGIERSAGAGAARLARSAGDSLPSGSTCFSNRASAGAAPRRRARSAVFGLVRQVDARAGGRVNERALGRTHDVPCSSGVSSKRLFLGKG